jgi:hypothetical protein
MKVLNNKRFLSILEEYHPEKLKYKPTIVEIVGNNVVFKMSGHEGYFNININMLD